VSCRVERRPIEIEGYWKVCCGVERRPNQVERGPKPAKPKRKAIRVDVKLGDKA
jgi:hypothetical protein